MIFMLNLLTLECDADTEVAKFVDGFNTAVLDLVLRY